MEIKNILQLMNTEYQHRKLVPIERQKPTLQLQHNVNAAD